MKELHEFIKEILIILDKPLGAWKLVVFRYNEILKYECRHCPQGESG
jgi:hypothetical protein